MVHTCVRAVGWRRRRVRNGWQASAAAQQAVVRLRLVGGGETHRALTHALGWARLRHHGHASPQRYDAVRRRGGCGRSAGRRGWCGRGEAAEGNGSVRGAGWQWCGGLGEGVRAGDCRASWLRGRRWRRWFAGRRGDGVGRRELVRDGAHVTCARQGDGHAQAHNELCRVGGGYCGEPAAIVSTSAGALVVGAALVVALETRLVQLVEHLGGVVGVVERGVLLRKVVAQATVGERARRVSRAGAEAVQQTFELSRVEDGAVHLKLLRVLVGPDEAAVGRVFEDDRGLGG